MNNKIKIAVVIILAIALGFFVGVFSTILNAKPYSEYIPDNAPNVCYIEIYGQVFVYDCGDYVQNGF